MYKVNHIEMNQIYKTDTWNDYEWFIDGKRLSEHLRENKYVKLPDNVEPFDNLCPAWTKQLECFGDVRFVWNLLQHDKSVLPIYICPDDLDFSCIVIVVGVEKKEEYVYWNRVGLVSQTDYDFLEEKKHGILDTDSYTEKDWKRYGDNIALAELDCDEWCQWISQNWDEELYRRRMNYTIPVYKNDKNIIWFANLDFEFERSKYEQMINEYWEEETRNELNRYNDDMSFNNCVNLIKKLARNGSKRLNEHRDIYGEVLLHIFASEEVGNTLFDLLQRDSDNTYIMIYTKAIELMWKYGDIDVKNVVDVTLLERLSEDRIVWNRLGKYISEDFKTYINEELIHNNIAMCGVLPIE